MNNNNAPGAAVVGANGPPYLPLMTSPDVPLCIYCGASEVRLTGFFRPTACCWLSVRFRLCGACVHLVASETPDAARIAQIIEANSETAAERFLDTFIGEGVVHDIRATLECQAKAASPTRVEIDGDST